MVVPSTLFEEFGFNYIGPIDGHDLDVADPDAEEHPGAEGAAVPACGHQEGPGLQARRGRSGALPRPGQIRSRRRHQEVQRRQAHLHPGVRRLAVRHGAARLAPGRHHAGDARRLGPGALRAGVPRPLFRRRHRRAARGDLRRRARLRGPEAGGGDLFDLPAARLRPADPRRVHPESAGRVRARPRRAGRRRRRHAQRRVRSRLPALHAQPDGDDARATRTSAGRCSTPRSSSISPAAVRYPRGAGPGVAVQKEMQALPLGKGELRRAGQAGRDPRVRQHAQACARCRGGARRDGRQHALCQAAGRGARGGHGRGRTNCW